MTRRIYQTEWQGIRFADIGPTSSRRLAGAAFYERFYAALFDRYASWDELTPTWRATKAQWAAFLGGRARGRCLAIGCGLGYVEHLMLERHPDLDLTIQEVAPTAWRWIGREIPACRRFTGPVPECLPADARYDFIYLATVDYAIPTDALVTMLAALRKYLTPDGEILLLPGLVDAHRPNPVKVTAAALLDVFALRPRGQWWGWARTRDEYRRMLHDAGYTDITDGWIEPGQSAHYWIRALRPLARDGVGDLMQRVPDTGRGQEDTNPGDGVLDVDHGQAREPAEHCGTGADDRLGAE